MSVKMFLLVIVLIGVFFLMVIPNSVEAQKAVAVSVGGGHVLVLMDDGTVYTWGSNNNGKLGIGIDWNESSWNPYRIPQKVLIDNVMAVSAGSSFSLALKRDGTLWAWGSNYYGELGDGSLNTSNKPVQVKGLTNVVAVTAGDNTNYALKSDGTVWAWGRNDQGQVGDGTLDNRLEPVQVKGLTNIIALGDGGNYAIKDDGSVWAWGSNDLDEGSYGALGDDSGPGMRLIPFQVEGVSNVKQISNGGSYAIHIKDDGSVWAWGCYDMGQLGDGSIHSSRPPPIKFPSVRTQIDNVKKVSCGGAYTIALKDDGTVWQWGMLIGDPRSKPFKVGGLDHVVDISASGLVCYALKDDGTIWGWGRDNQDCGMLGNNDKNRIVLITPNNDTISYIIECNPVLIFSDMAQPTVSASPAGTIGTAMGNSTVDATVSGVPTPGMNINSMLLAGLAVMVIYLTAKRWKKIR